MLEDRSVVRMHLLADVEHQNRDFLVLNIANEAIVADAISPYSAFLAPKSFSPLPKIIAARPAFTQQALTKAVPTRPAYGWVLTAPGLQCPSDFPRDRTGICESLRGHNSSCGDGFSGKGVQPLFKFEAHTEHVKRVQQRADRLSRSD